jgi:hypothetical protein
MSAGFVAPFRLLLLLAAAGSPAYAQSGEGATSRLPIELNAAQDVEGACRLTFVARNGAETTIDKAVFETVIFDTSGAVARLSLFDFRSLPAGRPRVRQFDLPEMGCDAIGQVLINGVSTCLVDGTESDICVTGLSLSSRVPMELLG